MDMAVSKEDTSTDNKTRMYLGSEDKKADVDRKRWWGKWETDGKM